MPARVLLRVLTCVVVSLALALVGSSTAQARPRPPQPQPDRTPPTTPGNVSASNVTQTGATMTWSPSTDNVGVVMYGAWALDVPVVYTPPSQTTATFTGLHPGTTYEFKVQAFDGINWSWPGIVNVTTLPDVSAPAAPTNLAVGTSVFGFPVDGVTAGKVLLTWTNATDDFGPISYQVLVNGTVSANVFDTRPAGTPIGSTSTAWVRQLEPGTSYQLAVRTVDGGGNVSAPSSPITVTTDASTDTQAPTTPTLTGAHSGGTSCCPAELWLTWLESTDNAQPSSTIEYEIRVNGTIIDVIPGGFNWITYTEIDGLLNVTLVAVDDAGNASAASNAQQVPV